MPQNLNEMLDRLTGGRRLAAVLVTVGTLAAMWGFTRWATEPAWVPLFRDAPVETVGEAAARLDEDGIEYRLERGGAAVSVREADVARARVALAAEGLPSAGRPGFELFDQPSWGMTDFSQRVNYRRALEGELERTIGTMRGVDAAQVHMALQESSFLQRSDRPAEASVVLTLSPTARADAGMVEGIRFLVAGSVEGMATENVTVLDDGGQVLSAPADPTTPEGVSNAQLAVRREVESHLEAKADDLLRRILGSGNASVRVAAELNFDRFDRTVQAVDPETQMKVQEGRSEILPGTEDQGASSVTSNATYEATRSVESLSRGGARIQRLSVAVLVNERRPGADETAATVMSPAELARIEGLVRAAVGVDDSRGDVISVAAVPFQPVPETPGPAAPGGTPPLEWLMMLQKPLMALVALGLAAAVAFRLLSVLKTPATAALPAGAAAAGSLPHGEASGAAPAVQGEKPKRVLPEPRAVEVERPEMTARVIRAWMKEA